MFLEGRRGVPAPETPSEPTGTGVLQPPFIPEPHAVITCSAGVAQAVPSPVPKEPPRNPRSSVETRSGLN